MTKSIAVFWSLPSPYVKQQFTNQKGRIVVLRGPICICTVCIGYNVLFGTAQALCVTVVQYTSVSV